MSEPDNSAPQGQPTGGDLPRLYSLNGIGFATFFGSMLAGFFLLAANYHALGMKKPAVAVLASGVIAFSVYFLMVMAWMGPASISPAVSQTGEIELNMTQAILSNVGQVMFLLLVTHLLQGTMLATFKEELQGAFHSITRSIFIGFAAYLGLASISLLLLTVLGLVPSGPSASLSS